MPYNFKKAFYGKRNRAVAHDFSKTVGRKAMSVAKRELAHGYKEFKKHAPAYIERYAPMAAEALAGAGDYRVKKYSVGRGFKKESGSMGYKSRRSVALEKGTMCIKHTEYLGDLVQSATSGAFTSQSYGLNPANDGTFPWLSSTAVNFQHYKFKKLVFEYRPLVSESTSTTTGSLLSMGSVILATQYDSILGPYTGKATMAESDYAVTIKPSERALHAVECKSKYNPLGVMFCSPQVSLTQGYNNSDIRMQNLGIFQIAASGVPTNGTNTVDLGEIWVHYEVELFKPQLNANLSALQSAHYYGSVATGNPTNNNPFGPNVSPLIQPTSVANNLLSLNFTVSSFTFPLQVTTGSFLCVYVAKGGSGTGFTYAAPTVTNGTGTLLTVFNGGTVGASQVSNYFGGAQSGLVGPNQTVIAFVVQVNAPGSTLCTVTMNVSVSLVTGQFDLFVTPYNSIMA